MLFDFCLFYQSQSLLHYLFMYVFYSKNFSFYPIMICSYRFYSNLSVSLLNYEDYTLCIGIIHCDGIAPLQLSFQELNFLPHPLQLFRKLKTQLLFNLSHGLLFIVSLDFKLYTNSHTSTLSNQMRLVALLRAKSFILFSLIRTQMLVRLDSSKVYSSDSILIDITYLFSLYLIYNFMNYKALLLLLLLLNIASAILIVGKSSNWKKCFYTEHSPDKTLQARLGFLRRERGNCRAIFSVKIVDQQDNMKEQVYVKQHRCELAKTNDPYVVKHTSQQTEFHGMYEVCVQMLQNQNQETLIEIYMGERLNPIIFEHSESPLPLVQSQELLDLDMTVQSIKRSLVKSRTHYQKNREKGEILDAKITEMMEVNQVSNILQIITIVVFGLVWISIAKRLKRSK